MYARVITAQLHPDRIDDFLRAWQEGTLPTVRQAAGFQDVTMYVDRATGRATMVAHYDSEAAATAAHAGMRERNAPLAEYFATPPGGGVYEVAVR
jgi:quinol monooxygenase YgiN